MLVTSQTDELIQSTRIYFGASHANLFGVRISNQIETACLTRFV